MGGRSVTRQARGHCRGAGHSPRWRRDGASSRLRAATVRRDGSRRRKGGPRVPRSGQACRRGHRYVDTSFTVRGLRAVTDYCFRVIAENGASQLLTVDHSFVPRTHYDKPSAPRLSDVTRSSVTLSWLARRWTAERRSWPTSSSSPEHPSPTWTRVARVNPQTAADRLPIPRLRRKCRDLSDRRLSDRFHGRRLTVAVTIRIGADEGLPSRSPTPSTGRSTERRRRGRRTVARLISDRTLDPTAADHPRRIHIQSLTRGLQWHFRFGTGHWANQNR